MDVTDDAATKSEAAEVDTQPEVAITPVSESPDSEEILLKSKSGLQLFCRYWKPAEPKPRAVVFLAHGFAEHSGYYETLAEELLKKSYYVFTHDHVGHGKSQGARVHVDSVDDYVTDVSTHFEKIDEEIDSSVPRFIVGHSMGGTIAIKAAMHHPDMFRGVVLVAPAVVPNPDVASPLKIFLAKMISRILPQFPVGPIDWKIVTRNKDMVEKYTNDKLCYHGKAKARWAVAMLNALQEIHNNLTNIEWPFLLLHGARDMITDISGSNLLFDSASSQDKRIKIYDEAAHNLLQELDDVRTSTLQEIVDWIEAKVITPLPAKPSPTTVAEVATSKNGETGGASKISTESFEAPAAVAESDVTLKLDEKVEVESNDLSALVDEKLKLEDPSTTESATSEVSASGNVHDELAAGDNH